MPPHLGLGPLALISEPNNINVYFDSDGNGFDERYGVYFRKYFWVLPAILV
jgi:hypothetical protein